MQQMYVKNNNSTTGIAFELFKSNICQRVCRNGQIAFIKETILSDTIENYWEKKDYLAAFYLLAMLDYLSRLNEIPLYNKYNHIRKYKMENRIYPLSVLTLENLRGIPKDELVKDAIPEFLKFNIVEGDVFNVK